MRKTYITKVPDKTGVFLTASRIISAHGGNIVRINYNKAVDTHTLFIEVAAEPSEHDAIARELEAEGFLTTGYDDRRVLMLALRIENVPGGVTPMLEVLVRHHINISYVSSTEDGTPYQHLKMGVLIEDATEVSRLIDELSQLCEVRILDYEITDRLLDGTVFYVNFANQMRDLLGLSDDDARFLLVRSNQLMQILDDQGRSPMQTFDYIRRFAAFITSHHGDAFDARVSQFAPAPDLTVHVIEPPCGSNTYVLETEGRLFFVDGGYGCFLSEMTDRLRQIFPAFDSTEREMMITHTDMDHTGLMPLFDRVWMSRSGREELKAEEENGRTCRERNARHRPYFDIARTITGHVPPGTARAQVFDEAGSAPASASGKDTPVPDPPGSVPQGSVPQVSVPQVSVPQVSVPETGASPRVLDGCAYFRRIGVWKTGRFSFDIYEGPGGHVTGEIVAVCEELRLVFSGDIYVNVRGITPEQKEFNRLAPFLLTGVDENPELARRAREELVSRLSGYTFCPGHGPVQTVLS